MTERNKDINRNGIIWTQSRKKEVTGKWNIKERHEMNMREQGTIIHYIELPLAPSAIPSHPPLFPLTRQNRIFGEDFRW